MHRRVIIRSLPFQIVLHAALLALLARFVPWLVFVLTAFATVLLHIYARERAKAHRYRAIVRRASAKNIEGFPDLSLSADPGTDDAALEALAELTAELEKKCYQLVEKNIQLLSLKEIGLNIISSLDEDRIIDSVESFLTRGLGFRECFAGILGQEPGTCRFYVFRQGPNEATRREYTVRVDALEGLMAKPFATRRPVFIRDPHMHQLGTIEGERLFEDSTMESYLVVPMVKSPFSGSCRHAADCLLKRPPLSEDQARPEDALCNSCGRRPVLGVLGVTDGFKASALSRADLASVETLALQISTMLENSRLYNELKQEEIFRQNVINSMMNGVVTVDTTGAILLVNEMAARLSGYGCEELKGRPIETLIVDGTGEGSPMMEGLDIGKTPFRKEAWLLKKSGEKLPVMLNTSFLKDESRQHRGVLGVFMDLTRIKRMEQEIAHLDKLAALGRFSSSMAHEIRNPLAGILAGIEYLRRAGSIPESEDENISFILKEVNRIDRLIGDLLGVVRVGDLDWQSLGIQPLIENSVRSVRDIAKEKRVEIVTTLPECDTKVTVDADRLTQVMVNLIKNAVEASSPGGEVRVRVSFSSGSQDVLFDDAGNLAIIEVQDDGAGFSEAHKGRIFEPFFTTKGGGTGLGLYVTHSIIERHGGYIFVDSEKGKGSTFTVYLPTNRTGHEKHSTVSHTAGR